MRKLFFIGPLLCALLCGAQTQTIPVELQGRWTIRRVIPTRSISCWGYDQGKKLLGTQIEYGSNVLTWRDVVTRDLHVTISTVTAKQFHDDNSSLSSDGSQVDFHQLGIRKNEVTQVELRHLSSKNLFQETGELPGDSVLLKNGNTIVFSVCGLFFEAKRVAGKSAQ